MFPWMRERVPDATPRDTVLSRTGEVRQIRERAMKFLWFLTAIVAVLAVFFIILFLCQDALPIFEKVGIVSFLSGETWKPTAEVPAYGTFPLITGTILVTLGAMLIATPLGIGSAIYISELAPLRVKMLITGRLP